MVHRPSVLVVPSRLCLFRRRLRNHTCIQLLRPEFIQSRHQHPPFHRQQLLPPGLELKFFLSPRVLTLMRCSFSVSADRVLQYCYVNKNKHSLLLASPSQAFIRYRHFFAFFPVHKMSNTASATLTSIVKFSSSPVSAYNSSVELITELRLLMYPWCL
jgi:hypothetical protein